MDLLRDARVLYQLAVPGRGKNHAERLEEFYARQSADYDHFRERLLPGRRELVESLDFPEGGTWLDLGGGTGSALEFAGPKLKKLKKAYVVDLSASLLQVADERRRQKRWKNVEVRRADVTEFTPPEPVDQITFSFSLTMIPEWFHAIDHAFSLLRPGGQIGVVDFFVSRKHEPENRATHSWGTRVFWPTWFGFDDVRLSPDHLPYLESRFQTQNLVQERSRVPYLPFAKVPVYRFLGRKPVCV